MKLNKTVAISTFALPLLAMAEETAAVAQKALELATLI